eukprot:g23181.t1
MLGTVAGSVAFHAARLRNRFLAYSVEEAALNILFCAASPDIEAPGGAFRGALIVPVAWPWPPRHPAAPWGAFMVSCWLSAFRVKYMFPYTVDVILVAFVVIWLASLLAAIYARYRITEPTWFTYLCFALGVAVLAGPLCGDRIFRGLTQHYYRVGDLKETQCMSLSIHACPTLWKGSEANCIHATYHMAKQN